MAKLIYTILILSFLSINCRVQKNKLPKIEKVYLDTKDSSRNCYTVIYPQTSPSNGYVFIVPGFGETAENVLQQTDLPVNLATHGFLTIIPTFQDGVLSFGADSSTQESFKKILNDVISKQNLTNQKFYVGGYSIGGSCVIKYAENPSIKPTAVFAVDPPIDFEQLYYTNKRLQRLSVNSQPNEETNYIIQRLEEMMNGSPATSMDNYYKTSPYSFTDSSQYAIKKLLNVPLRIYTEPDVHWWMRERGEDFTSMNSIYHSAMINELNRLGNQKAELITTQNKGYRKPDNKRHPHSWSIVDNDDLITWLLKQE